MDVIPAVDIRQGRCVRLFQGKADAETVYYENPAEAALFWEKKGASRIHFVDLDGAMGTGDNSNLIADLTKKSKLKVQIGGGIRDIAKARKYIELGASRIVLGTSAVKTPEIIRDLAKYLSPEQIIVSLDANHDGKIAIKGWTEITPKSAFEYGKIFEEYGAGYILYSAIEQDGTFNGPDLKNTKKMVESVKIPVYAAGGTRNKEDIFALREIGVHGVIIGKAFYENKINFDEVKNL